MNENCFEWLQHWYQSQCDEDWEHSYSVKIETLDNPGWLVLIDLKDTELEDVTFASVGREEDEHDWISCMKKNDKFQGAGDPQKLIQIIETFKSWATSANVKTE